MEQLAFFPEEGQSTGLPKELLEYHPNFIDQRKSDELIKKFIAESPWQQRVQHIYDKDVITPRLTAWYGDPEAFDYAILGKSAPTPSTRELLSIKAMVEPLAGVKFNSVLLNYYRDGNDSVAGTVIRKTYLEETR